ncbi:hypothetical protein GCM10027067_32910 [Pseudactinotalea suaedae]
MGVAVAIGLVAGASDDSGGGSPFGGGGAPELEAEWSLSSYDFGDHGSFDSADGTVPGTILSTSNGWVTMVEPGTLEATLVSVEPDTGEVHWSTPMPEGRCTSTDPDSILCLTRDGGSQFQLLTLTAETGEVVGDPVPTDLTRVPVLLVPMGGEGWVTLSITAELAGLDLQGRTLWTEQIELGDYEVEWLDVDTAAYASSVILSLGPYVGTVQAGVEGAAVHECRGVAVTPEAWMCQGEDEAVGRAPDGTELWREDWQDYYLVDQYQRIAPVMIVDNWDGTVSAVDPLTGEHAAAVDMGSPEGSFNFLGDTEHPFVLTEDSINLLDTGLTTVLWSAPIRDEYLNIAGGGVIGEVLVIDGESSWGFDLATGDELWRRGFLPYDVMVIDEALVGLRITELLRYALP